VKRRSFLKTAAVGGGAAIAGAPAIVKAQQNIQWRMASSFPKSLDTIYGGGELIAKRVAELTNNRFQIRVFAAGEIVPGLQVFDAVSNGTIECGHTVSYYYVGKDPTFALDSCIPFGLNARQQISWMYQGGGMALMREFFREYNTVQFPSGNTGTQMGGWFRKEIKSIADLNGLKFRIAGFAGQVLQKQGVVPQQLAGGDIYPALEKGTIDAAEWVGPYDDEKLGFYKVAKFYYYPGWWEGGPQVSLHVNAKQWESLPKEYQAALETACAYTNQDMLAEYDMKNPLALRKLVAGGAQLRAFPRDVMQACYNTAFDIYDDLNQKNPKWRKVFESWNKYREEQLLWFRVAERNFDEFVMTAKRGAR
jgi:TRAP-type mannitol/chloroaromatic compound transport system substrate-binding protein